MALTVILSTIYRYQTQKEKNSESVARLLGQAFVCVDGAVTAVLQSPLLRQVHRHFIIA